MLRRVFTRQILVRVVAGVVGSVLGLEFVIWLGERGVYNLGYAEYVLPELLPGFYLSIKLVAYVVSLGFVLGLVVGWARTSSSYVLRGLGGLFVDFFRSMPPLVLIVFAFLIGSLLLQQYLPGEPYLRETIALTLGATALAFHTGAYQAEIVRAGILSVPTGQTEAATAVGLSKIRTMFLVTLPQAFRVSLPALGNEFSSVIKDTSLLSAIGWLELSGLGIIQIYSGIKVTIYAPFIIWPEIAVFYFVITFALNVSVRAIEEAFKVPGLGAAAL